MPKRQRLSRADFTALGAAKQRRFFGLYFSLSVGNLPLAKDTDQLIVEPRCACVVSKKVAKDATDRNLIKRRCREACRLETAELKMPVSLVFYAKKEAKGASYTEIQKDVSRLIAPLK